jgi:hypothetical protein
LLGVMNDSTADPEQRVKAAAVAARYKHPYAGESDVPTVSVVEDKFGFKVDPELARAERDDRIRERRLQGFKERSAEGIAAKSELERIAKRREERLTAVKFPDGYSYDDRQKDENRLGQLYSKRLSRKRLTPEEEAEEAHLAVRVLHSKAEKPKIVLPSLNKYKMEWPMTRMVELEERVLAGDTIPAEEDELQELRSQHPEIAADVDRLDHRYNYCVRCEREKAEKAGRHWLDGYRAAQKKCEPLRDPRKMLDLEELREGPRKRIYALEVLRFDEKITREEADELEDWHRRYPQRAEKTRNLVVRRLSNDERQRGYARQYGQDPGPIKEDEWPRLRTRRFGLPEG